MKAKKVDEDEEGLDRNWELVALMSFELELI